MKTLTKIFLALCFATILSGLLSCAHAPKTVYRVQYAKASDIIVVRVLKCDSVRDTEGCVLFLYEVKGREDTKTFKVSSWNRYKVGTETELSENDSFDGSF